MLTNGLEQIPCSYILEMWCKAFKEWKMWWMNGRSYSAYDRTVIVEVGDAGLAYPVWTQYACVTPNRCVPCVPELLVFRLLPAVLIVLMWLITTGTEGLQHICSAQLISNGCLLRRLMLKRLHGGKSASPEWVRCAVVRGKQGIACSVKMNMRQTDSQAVRQRQDRQTDKSPLVSSSSSSPLSSLLFCSCFQCSAVLLFSLRDETHDAMLCCLSAFNICLPLPPSPPTRCVFLCSSPVCTFTALIFAPVTSLSFLWLYPSFSLLVYFVPPDLFWPFVTDTSVPRWFYHSTIYTVDIVDTVDVVVT